MKDSRSSVTSAPPKDIPGTDNETINYDECVLSNDTIISKIKTYVERGTDSHIRDSVKYLINSVMEDDSHVLHKDIDELLTWRNDVLDLVCNLDIDDNLRTVIQTLVRELALRKMKCKMYHYAMCCLNHENELLTSKVKDYFIHSILQESCMKKVKKSPIIELKILENIINRGR